jgi:putative transposase
MTCSLMRAICRKRRRMPIAYVTGLRVLRHVEGVRPEVEVTENGVEPRRLAIFVTSTSGLTPSIFRAFDRIPDALCSTPPTRRPVLGQDGIAPLRRAMPRPLRLQFPGAVWHVTNRGVEKRSIYADDCDRLHFLHLLEKVIDDCRWQLRAYVLMSNHYHLFFRTPLTNLSRGMQDLDGDYASFFNARHRRVGHLFQGRFKGHLVDSERYLLSLSRYIVLNPVRAGMVETPGEWRWSSYRATAGLAAVPRWLDPAPILDAFNADDWNKAMHGYREFVAAAIGQDASPWENLVAGMFLGGKAFVEGIRSEVEVLQRQAISIPSTSDLKPCTIECVRQAVQSMDIAGTWPPPPGSDARMVVALFASRHAQASRAEIARLLGVTGPGALHLIRSSETRIRTDARFAELVLAIEQALARKGSDRK